MFKKIEAIALFITAITQITNPAAYQKEYHQMAPYRGSSAPSRYVVAREPNFSRYNQYGPVATPIPYSNQQALGSTVALDQKSAEWFKTLSPERQISMLNKFCTNYTQALSRLKQYMPQQYTTYMNNLKRWGNVICTAQFSPIQMIEAIEQPTEINTGAINLDAFLNQPIKELKTQLIKIMFNADGSYKGLVNDRAVREYARVTESFLQKYIYPQNPEKVTTVIKQLSDAGFTAFDYRAGNAPGVVELSRDITFSAQLLRSVDTTQTYKSIEAIKRNPFNKALKKFYQRITNRQYTEAQRIISQHSAGIHGQQQVRIFETIYQHHVQSHIFGDAAVRNVNIDTMSHDLKSQLLDFTKKQASIDAASLDMYQKLYIANETNYGIKLFTINKQYGLAFGRTTQQRVQTFARNFHNITKQDLYAHFYQIGKHHLKLTNAQAVKYAQGLIKNFCNDSLSFASFSNKIYTRIKHNLNDVEKFGQRTQDKYCIKKPESNILDEAHLNSRSIKHSTNVETTQRMIANQIADNITLSIIAQTLDTPRATSSPAASSSSSSQPSSSSAGASSSSSTSAKATADRSGSTTILGEQAFAVPAEDKSDLSFQKTDAARYSVVEYIKQTDKMLAKMEKGPAQIAATSIRDYMATQWDELCIEGSELVEDLKRFGSALKDQHALMTADALCNMFDRAINDMIIIANPLDEWKEGLADIAWHIQKAGELTEGIARSFVKLQDGIFTPMDTEKFIALVRNGNTQEAARMMVDANPIFAAIQERVLYNLQHPVSFLGRTSRGLLDVGMTGEQFFADALLHPLRTEAEQAMLSAQYTETFENFVKTLNTATPEQINDVVASAIADGLTFKVWHSAHSAIRASATAAGGGASSSSSSSSSSGTGIVPQQQRAAVPSAPGSFAESEPPAIRVTPRLIAAQQARQQPDAHPSSRSSSSEQMQRASSSSSSKPKKVEKPGTFRGALEEPAGRTVSISLKNEKIIVNDVLASQRVGSALKKDAHHAFNDIIDNYAGYAQEFDLLGDDAKLRKLFQIEGSLNGVSGIFEWIVEPQNNFVTHRLFIKNGSITGKPNIWKK